jgi:hypothetical protein
VSDVTDCSICILNPRRAKLAEEVTMLTLNRLDAIDADRLHRKLGRISSSAAENLTRRRYRLQCRVFLHLHKALLRACAG